jgi:hypothetical protein
VPQSNAETRVRRVDVEHPELAVTGVSEAMDGADRSGDVRAGTGAHDVGADRELRLALQHVEGIDVVGVRVRLDSLEVRAEAQLDYLELAKLGQDAVMPVPARDSLPAVRLDDEAVH